MFERFTDRARRAIELAAKEARLLEYPHIGTEHILLALVQGGEDADGGDGVAASALHSFGVTLDETRVQVEKMYGKGKGSPSGLLTFTPRAKKALKLSIRDALSLGHNYIGTEHILLSLIREGEGSAMQVLTKVGIDGGALKTKILEIIAARPSQPHTTHQDIIHITRTSQRIEVSAELMEVVYRAVELAGSDQLSLSHLQQALREAEGT